MRDNLVYLVNCHRNSTADLNPFDECVVDGPADGGGFGEGWSICNGNCGELFWPTPPTYGDGSLLRAPGYGDGSLLLVPPGTSGQPPSPRSPKPNTCASATPIADDIAEGADFAATGLAIGAAASSETVIGGVSLGVLAGIAKGVSFAANAYSAYENYNAGNRLRAGATAASAVVGAVGGKPVEMIGSAAERRGMQLAMSPKGIKGLAEGSGYVTGKVAGLAICP